MTKPVDEEYLVAAIAKALARDAASRRRGVAASRVQHEDQTRMRGQLASSTPRERQVLAFVARGKPNKQIAGELGTTEKTVKVHRGRAMQKMGVRTMAGLVRNSNAAASTRRSPPTQSGRSTARAQAGQPHRFLLASAAVSPSSDSSNGCLRCRRGCAWRLALPQRRCLDDHFRATGHRAPGR